MPFAGCAETQPNTTAGQAYGSHNALHKKSMCDYLLKLARVEVSWKPFEIQKVTSSKVTSSKPFIYLPYICIKNLL